MATGKSRLPSAAIDALRSGCNTLTTAFAIGAFLFGIGLLTRPGIVPLGGVLLCAFGLTGTSKLLKGIEILGGQPAASEEVQPAPVVAAPVQAPVRQRAAEPMATTYTGDPSPSKPEPRKKVEPAKPSWTESIDWEEWVGKKLLQKAGIAIVLIGMAIFLKYSFDNRWIDELGRVLLGIVAAGIMIGAGEWFRARYRNWALAFTGGGLSLLYFVVWISHVLYAVQLRTNYGLPITETGAFMLYALLTAAAVAAAIRYNSQTIAWFALLGGYLTPLLIELPERSPLTLSAYLALLSAGLVTLALSKRWSGLELVSFILTQCYLFSSVYGSGLIDTTAEVLIAISFALLFAAPMIIRGFVRNVPLEEREYLTQGANAFVTFISLLMAVGGWGETWTTAVCFGMAAVYALFCAASIVRRPNDDAMLTLHTIVASATVSAGLFSWLDIEWALLGFAPLSVVIAWLAARLDRRPLFVSACGMLAMSALLLLSNLPFVDSPTTWKPFLSDWALQSYVFLAAIIAWIFVLPRVPQKALPQATQSFFLPMLHMAAGLTGFLWVTFEMATPAWNPNISLLFAYLAFTGVCLGLFVATRQIVWFVGACVVNAIILLTMFTWGDQSLLTWGVHTSDTAPVFHLWTLVSLLSLMLTAALSLTTVKRASLFAKGKEVRTSLMIIGLSQLWLHGTVEVARLGEWMQWDADVAHRLLSGWWIVFALALIAWGSRVSKESWRMAGIALLAVPFVHDLSVIINQQSAVYELGLWSLLALALAGIGAKRGFKEVRLGGIGYLLAVAGADMLFHLGSATGLLSSVWWAVVALAAMAIGFATFDKDVRRASIAIFGAMTVKLLIFDFSALETPVRIMASIVTGLLLIGASYLYQRFDEASAPVKKQ